MKKRRKLVDQNYYKDGFEHHRFDGLWVWTECHKVYSAYSFKTSNRNKMIEKTYWLLWKRNYKNERIKFYHSIKTGEW